VCQKEYGWKGTGHSIILYSKGEGPQQVEGSASHLRLCHKESALTTLDLATKRGSNGGLTKGLRNRGGG